MCDIDQYNKQLEKTDEEKHYAHKDLIEHQLIFILLEYVVKW
jgi:hypothetical protein